MCRVTLLHGTARWRDVCQLVGRCSTKRMHVRVVGMKVWFCWQWAGCKLWLTSMPSLRLRAGGPDFEGEAGPEPAPGWHELIRDCWMDDPSLR